MKIDGSKKIRNVAGENIIIRQADGVSDMTSVVAFNDTALELCNKLNGRDFTVDDVVRLLVDTYEVDAATARTDAEAWLEQMRSQGMIID